MLASAAMLAHGQTNSTAGEIYKQAAPSVVSIEGKDDKGTVRWAGTGFVVAPDGKILTNYHVIRNSKQATVRLANGDAYDSVEVMDVDRRKDIALLKIKAEELLPLRIGNSRTVQVGDPVYSLSNALGLDNTLSEGLISGIRQMDGYRLLQVTAPISHGSSGAPLFNAKGDVIGITTLSLQEGQSLNFAIPIDYARGILATPSQPAALATVYDPEQEPGNAKPPAETSTPATQTKPVTTGNVPSKAFAEMLQSGLAEFLDDRLLKWMDNDASSTMGEPLSHRYGYDNAHNVTQDIFSYSDPTLQMQKVELGFDVKTRRLTNIYLYPLRMTWDECKNLYGTRYRVQYLEGRKFYLYKDRRLNVQVDKHNNVFSMGLYAE